MTRVNPLSLDLFEEQSCNNILPEKMEENTISSTTVDGIQFTQPPIDHSTQPSNVMLLMNSYFDFIYAKALCEVKCMTVRKNCYGCQINHPSQREHDCIMKTNNDEYEIDFYFEEMLKEVKEEDIIRSWLEVMCISNISSQTVALHKQVLESKDFLEVMKTDQWKSKMKRMVLTIIQIEDRLFRTSF